VKKFKLRFAVTNRSTITADVDSGRNAAMRAVIVEFGRHLDMLAERLGASLLEADRECESVGESFRDMAAAKNTIDGVSCQEPEQSILRDSCRQICESLHAAVVALQYHDRLSQRLGLIRTGLNRLQNLFKTAPPALRKTG
jgi:hypothetical protein